ncbi:hypothetical protein Nepgr_019552 [Nepenthes gracilis]|uniref:Uncharacterized protein n=1 Tax=Nepenthes gracilis TaxID=150966 RepID=A0AAD3SVI6_NEPGR|nr:hypothetical protein Nepgr_019552 [Nepenthes gracilis]
MLRRWRIRLPLFLLPSRQDLGSQPNPRDIGNPFLRNLRALSAKVLVGVVLAETRNCIGLKAADGMGLLGWFSSVSCFCWYGAYCWFENLLGVAFDCELPVYSDAFLY